MTVLEIYEKVNIKTPIEQRMFLNYLNDSINEIAALYSDIPKAVFYESLTAADVVSVKSILEEIPVLPLYHNALVDNILFLCGQGDEYKGEFIRKSREAYLHYWNEFSRGKRIRNRGW